MAKTLVDAAGGFLVVNAPADGELGYQPASGAVVHSALRGCERLVLLTEREVADDFSTSEDVSCAEPLLVVLEAPSPTRWCAGIAYGQHGENGGGVIGRYRMANAELLEPVLGDP